MNYDKKLIFSVFVGLVTAGLFSATLYVSAVPPDNMYTPGEIPDPGCLPGTTNCNVNVPSFSFQSNDFSGTGNFSTTGSVSAHTLSVGSAYIFPASAGSTSQFLGYNGSGIFGWQTIGILGNISGLVKGAGNGTYSSAIGTDYQAPLPSQSSHNGEFLTTNGSSLSWTQDPGHVWTESSGLVYPTTTTDRILLAGATDDTSSILQVNGNIYATKLGIKGTSTLPNQAASFNGSTFVTASDAGFPTGDSPMSFFTWVKTSSHSSSTLFGYGSISSHHARYFSVDHYSAHSLFFSGHSDDYSLTGVTVDDGNWHFVGFSYSGTGHIDFYVDGTKYSRTLPGGALNTQLTGTSYLGSDNGGLAIGSLNGLMQEAQVYNTALSQSDVTALYNSGAGVYGTGSESGLIAGYHFNGSAGDYSSNGNYGTWTGTSAYVTSSIAVPSSTSVTKYFSYNNGLLFDGSPFIGSQWAESSGTLSTTDYINIDGASGAAISLNGGTGNQDWALTSLSGGNFSISNNGGSQFEIKSWGRVLINSDTDDGSNATLQAVGDANISGVFKINGVELGGGTKADTLHNNIWSNGLLAGSGGENNNAFGYKAGFNNTGTVNHAASFNGSSFISASDSNLPSGSSPFSISAWFNAPNTGVNSTILDFGTSSSNQLSRLFLTDRGSLDWYNGSGGQDLSTPRSFSYNTWHHVVITRNGTTISMYVDGILVKTGTRSSGILLSGTLKIGYSDTGYFNGKIQEVQIYNTTLDQTAVTALYNSGNGVYGTGSETGLVAGYHLNGNTTDYKGSNNGTWTGVATYVTGLIGNTFYQAGNFNGSSYIDVPHSSALDFETGDFTVGFWVNLNNLNGMINFLDDSTSAWNGIHFESNNSNLYCFVGGDYTSFTNPVLVTNKWTYVVLTRSSVNVKLYVNNVVTQTATMLGNVTTGGDLTIGASLPRLGYPRYLNGKIQEVQIYNRPLSSLEVSSLYNNGNGVYGTGSESGLVAGYHLNGDATDYSSSHNNGTWTGTPAYTVGAINVSAEAENNNFFGYMAGFMNTFGLNNNFFGYKSGYFNTIGSDNFFAGYQAGYGQSGLSTGSNNMFIGNASGFSNTTGNNNNFLGRNAGYSNTTGANNNFLGYYAGKLNTDGSYNNFVGYKAGQSNTTGSYNNFMGYNAGADNTTGSSNIFLGSYSGNGNTTGSNNVFLGSHAGNNKTDSSSGAASFNGASYIQTSNMTTGVGDFAYSLWVEPNFDNSYSAGKNPMISWEASDGYHHLYFRFENGHTLWIDSGPGAPSVNIYWDGNLICGTFNCTSLPTYHAGKWHHLVVTGTNSDSGLSGLPIFIGAAPSIHPNKYFHGAMQEVQIYNRILSQSDVTALYSNGNGVYGTGAESGLIAAYHLNGNASDYKGSTNGSWVGSEKYTQGIFNTGNTYQAASFNGSSHIRSGDNNLPTGSSDLSTSFWFKTSTKTTQWIYQTGNMSSADTDFNILMDNNGHLAFAPNYNSNNFYGVGTTNLADGNWHHCVVTHSSGTFAMYVDNKLETLSGGSYSGTLNIVWSGYSYIGIDGDVNIYPLLGKLEEFQVYDRALSSSDVSALYNNGAGVYGTGSESGLVAGYHLNGDATDYKGSNNGTWTGTEAYTSGVIVNSYSQSGNFNGSSYITASNAVDISSGGTISAWAYATSISGNPRIVGNTINSYPSLMVWGGKLSAQVIQGGGGTDIATTYTFPLNQWVHVVMTFSASGLNLYANGENIYSDSTPTYEEVSIPEIGNDSSGDYWNGKIEEVQIYNKVLSQSDVTTLYNNSNGVYGTGLEPGLVAGYHLNGDATDYKGLNNGTWTGTEAYVTGTIMTGSASNTLVIDSTVSGRTNPAKQSLIAGAFASTPVEQSLSINAATINMPYLNVGAAGALKVDSSGKLWVDSSSLRFKTNVRPLLDNWDKILQTVPKSFTYKPTGEKEIGYIAEDFNALGLTDLVNYGKDNLPDSINYDRITLYDTEVIKEQQADIKLLQELNASGITGSGAISGITQNSLILSAGQLLANVGTAISNGITTISDLVSGHVTAKIAKFGQMQIVAPNGDVYCTWIQNGQWQKAKGTCATVLASLSLITPAITGSSPETATTPATAQQIAQTQEAVQQTVDTVNQVNEQVQQVAQQQAQATDQAVQQATQQIAQQATQQQPVQTTTIPAETPSTDQPAQTSLTQTTTPATVPVATDIIQNATSSLVNGFWNFILGIFGK